MTAPTPTWKFSINGEPLYYSDADSSEEAAEEFRAQLREDIQNGSLGAITNVADDS